MIATFFTAFVCIAITCLALIMVACLIGLGLGIYQEWKWQK